MGEIQILFDKPKKTLYLPTQAINLCDFEGGQIA